MTSLTDGTTTINLPDSLEWENEFDYSPITQDVKRTIGGGLIIQEAALLHGIPITLQGGENVWFSRQLIKQIATIASVAGKELVLTLSDEREFNVVFRRDDGAPFSAVPLWRKNVQVDADKMKRLVLKFYTIEGS